MLTCSASLPCSRLDLLQHQREFQHVAHRIGLGDDVVGQCAMSEAPMYFGGGQHDAQFALRNGRVTLDVGQQNLARLQSLQQRFAFCSFVEAGVVRHSLS